uniref:Carb-bd_dom_fam9 domain-containing protein n=1 Tax=Panagrellus redivivus TaxID=6233 RepID=A0A7E4V2Z0_PANRE
MISIRSFVLFAVFNTVAYVFEYTADIFKPSCSLISTNKADYDIYSVPGEVYIAPKPVPETLITDRKKRLPYMTEFYTALPDKATDGITFFGYWDQPDVSFTMVFGGRDDDVSFILVVDNGTVVVQQPEGAQLVDLPADFAISLNFAFDGVLLRLVDMTDEKNPTTSLEWTCLAYRSIPNGISHMAIFTDCVSVKFEMINILFYNQDYEEVRTKIFASESQLPTSNNAVITMFPHPNYNEIFFHGKARAPPQIYTATVKNKNFLIFGEKKSYHSDMYYCEDAFECYVTWKAAKPSKK